MSDQCSDVSKSLCEHAADSDESALIEVHPSPCTTQFWHLWPEKPRRSFSNVVVLCIVLTTALLAACMNWKERSADPSRHSPAPVRLLSDCNGTAGNLSKVTRGEGERCFCLFTRRCLDVWGCHRNTLEQCQQKSCEDRVSLEVTDFAASFYSMKDHADLLTIPVPYYETIVALKADCQAETLLTALLDAGRRVFKSAGIGGKGKPDPEIQCVHLPVAISVHWLHVHTFIGAVPGEGLPGLPPHAVCARVNLTTTAAARMMLSHTP
eukprot:TRINITY_DN19854_c0_g1_i1.p1 TRINITY_DN19854_c0_g1~~TRINITY_DN19854_c0_g1_i1.p1  ORF type:complete len:282 (-),score=20.17 TRINITY_DN19854_c0_g1_i1:256-1053(-)